TRTTARRRLDKSDLGRREDRRIVDVDGDLGGREIAAAEYRDLVVARRERDDVISQAGYDVVNEHVALFVKRDEEELHHAAPPAAAGRPTSSTACAAMTSAAFSAII